MNNKKPTNVPQRTFGS